MVTHDDIHNIAILGLYFGLHDTLKPIVLPENHNFAQAFLLAYGKIWGPILPVSIPSLFQSSFQISISIEKQVFKFDPYPASTPFHKTMIGIKIGIDIKTKISQIEIKLLYQKHLIMFSNVVEPE